MDFLEELKTFTVACPKVGHAEVFCVDLNGVCRGKLVPISTLKKLTSGGMKLPSSTAGLDLFGDDVYEAGLAVQKGDPDGPVVPVSGTLGPMLWADGEHPTAQVQVVPALPDGSVAPYDPRNVLARVVDRFGASGLTPVTALELEFFLIDPSDPLPPKYPVTGQRMMQGQVYDLDVTRAFAPVLHGIIDAAAALGAEAETAISEFGYGQFEINLMHSPDPLAIADRAVALKRAVRGVARQHGLDATFMAKPWGDTVGSGLHMHLSVLGADGQNIFSARDGPGQAGSGQDGPNARMRHAIAGALAYMGDAMLVFAPHLNSYRRFIPGLLAPTEALWAIDHRYTAIRVPEVSGPAARIEHRTAGADANPYLVSAAILASVLAGLEASEEPAPPVSGEIAPGMGPKLPDTWQAAEQVFAGSGFVEEWMGAPFQYLFACLKRQECTKLLSRVTDVEMDTYLRRL
ncbi:MAG: glutamine synthetase family protein [Pseudomonadota bacterium]